MVRRVLMIAYHYPPSRISSGIQRTLNFSRYLSDFGWHPEVLSVSPRAYDHVGTDQLAEIPQEVTVERAFALDTSRHLAFRGRYPLILALPDRWSTWWLGGVWSGLRMIRRQRPDFIWSTYPIATAHLIALTLHRLTGVPWIADCRDSMTEDHYPGNPRVKSAYLGIERRMVQAAGRVTFTTPGARCMYAERYPEQPDAKWRVLPNGYDELNFQSAERSIAISRSNGPKVFIHSGILYPSERDPTEFFNALEEMKRERRISADRFKVVLRASGHDEVLAPMIAARHLTDIVKLEPTVSYERALAEMLSADGLLLFQASNCNHQIPAKLYEYMRARRPLLALTDSDGDTARTMADAGISTIVPLDDKEAIKKGMCDFIRMVDEGSAPLASDEIIRGYSRRAGTEKLAGILDELVS